MTNNPNELKKIDELMAVEVMGYEWVLLWAEYNDNPYDDKEYKFYGVRDEDYGYWSPCTDMNQAMECLREFRKGNKEWIYCEIVSPTPGYYKLRNCTDEFDKADVSAYEKSEPLAICKAILKAKGIEWT